MTFSWENYGAQVPWACHHPPIIIGVTDYPDK
jgi:hypothetical protein